MNRIDEATQAVNNLVAQLQHEGLLDEQFIQLMQLQDETNPDFVVEVVQLYFDDSVSKIERMHTMFMSSNVDYNELDQIVHQLKGSSASLGAMTVAQHCIHLRESCEVQDVSSCRLLVSQIADSFSHLKTRLDVFVHLEERRKYLLSGGS
jgi:histidine-containing phosphotransfer protein